MSTSLTDKSKVGDKSDDPIRMYLREMGGVELLSREGEIAIAKRIEAGKNVMTNGLFQSPITAKKVFEWKEKLEKNELLIREIIDIDSTYIEGEDADPILKKTKQKEKTAANEKSVKFKENFLEPKDNKETEDNKNQEHDNDTYTMKLSPSLLEHKQVPRHYDHLWKECLYCPEKNQVHGELVPPVL